MKTEVFLVRHGETPWNKVGRFQGCTDISLAAEGIQQAILLKEKLNEQFDCVYTSPLSRAVQTAKIICQDTANINPVIVEDLREINFGEWEGLTIEQIKNKYPLEFQMWKTDEEHANLMGGDLNLKNASTRVTNAIRTIVNDHDGERIIIVAHGGILKASLIGLFDWKMTMYHRFFLGNTSITKLSFGNNLIPILISLNDMSHIS